MTPGPRSPAVGRGTSAAPPGVERAEAGETRSTGGEAEFDPAWRDHAIVAASFAGIIAHGRYVSNTVESGADTCFPAGRPAPATRRARGQRAGRAFAASGRHLSGTDPGTRGCPESNVIATAREEGMAPERKPGPSVKDDETYEALREQGASKEKAARIANARANDEMKPSRKGGKAPAYEDWTREDLYERAREIGIEGRSDMTKDELIDALRSW